MGSTTFKTGIVLTLLLGLIFAHATPVTAGPVDSVKDFFSGKKKKKTDRKTSAAMAGCLEGSRSATAQGGSAGSKEACVQGAARGYQAEQERERQEQEMLQRKDAAAFEYRIDRVNQRIADRQPRIERINLVRSGDAEPVPVVLNKKCSNDPECRKVAEEQAAALRPGVLGRFWYWLFPAKAPAAKAELTGIESDIALLKRSIDEIKVEIQVQEDAYFSARDVKQKSAISRDKGVLISELSQASQALSMLKTQQGELDKGYFAYLLMALAAIGGTIFKKISDGAALSIIENTKNIAKTATRRRKKQPAREHSMY
ncbi:MAG: hypothetical protein PSY14_12370 [bacterium]|nr:hypothetical protein [bacterium]